MNPETIVSAQVILVAADGSSPGPEARVTGENVARWTPAGETVMQVTRHLREMGFYVGKCVGNNFSITGAKQLFESGFHTELHEAAGGGIRFTGDRLELPTGKIPPALKGRIASITFTAAARFRTRCHGESRMIPMDGELPITAGRHSLARAIRESELMKAGGCAIYRDLPGGATRDHLLEESSACLGNAVASFVAESDAEEVRGGEPARRFISAGGGARQAAFYRSPEIACFLSGICNAPVRPTGENGTYTYYARPGDHLALHRDIDTCDIAVITCLLDRYHQGSAGGLTRYYPTRQHEPLSRIRATPSDGAVSVRLPVGHTMVMFGGLVPHLIEPLAHGELRIVSILCFRVHAE